MKQSSRFWWLSLQSELIDDLIETGVSSIDSSFFINFWKDWKSAKSPFCDVSSSSDSDDSPDDDFNGFELYLVLKKLLILNFMTSVLVVRGPGLEYERFDCDSLIPTDWSDTGEELDDD